MRIRSMLSRTCGALALLLLIPTAAALPDAPTPHDIVGDQDWRDYCLDEGPVDELSVGPLSVSWHQVPDPPYCYQSGNLVRCPSQWL